ncbi:MAG: hypothetical protein CSYNP_00303 [Syntrophus sp. SKADARSKE-3]|nr:hypothetical protein [Syntrophus sp. SKADARSKE-3]
MYYPQNGGNLMVKSQSISPPQFAAASVGNNRSVLYLSFLFQLISKAIQDYIIARISVFVGSLFMAFVVSLLTGCMFATWITPEEKSIGVVRKIGADMLVAKMAISPDGRRLAIGGANPIAPAIGAEPTFRVIDLATGKTLKEVKNLAYNELVTALSYSPDGRYLAYGVNQRSRGSHPPRDTMQILDAQTLETVRPLPGPDYKNGPEDVLFSPDSKKVAVSYQDYVNSNAIKDGAYMYDSESGHLVCTMSASLHCAQGMHFSHDGRHLLCADLSKTKRGKWGGRKDILFVYDAATCVLEKDIEIPPLAFLSRVAFHDNTSRSLAAIQERPNSNRGDEINIWTVQEGTIIKTLANPCGDKQISGVSFSPDGRYLIASIFTGSVNDKQASLSVWDTETWELLGATPSVPFSIKNLTFSPDGRRFYGSGYDNRGGYPFITEWEMDTLLKSFKKIK